SLFMTDEDRDLIVRTIRKDLEKRKRPIVILHGTDTMTQSAETCLKAFPHPEVPIVFTGAMRPMGFVDSDAHQNVTEALIAARLLSPGIYISFHNRIFPVPRVQKNKKQGTFES